MCFGKCFITLFTCTKLQGRNKMHLDGLVTVCDAQFVGMVNWKFDRMSLFWKQKQTNKQTKKKTQQWGIYDHVIPKQIWRNTRCLTKQHIFVNNFWYNNNNFPINIITTWHTQERSKLLPILISNNFDLSRVFKNTLKYFKNVKILQHIWQLPCQFSGYI